MSSPVLCYWDIRGLAQVKLSTLLYTLTPAWCTFKIATSTWFRHKQLFILTNQQTMLEISDCFCVFLQFLIAFPPADPSSVGVHGDRIRGQATLLRSRLITFLKFKNRWKKNQWPGSSSGLWQVLLVWQQVLPRLRLPQPPLFYWWRHQTHPGFIQLPSSSSPSSSSS